VPTEHTSGYIRHGWIVLLPRVDKLRKATSHGPSSACVVCADPKEVQQFRAGLKAGNNSLLVSGNFPLLVPSHFLKTQDDVRKNTGPSFSSIAAKGVKPGAKISPRSPLSSLPSWSETWTKASDWFLVPEGQEDLLRRGLGCGFHAQFSGALWEGICEADEMASRDGASGDFWLELMGRWLKEQAMVQELVRSGQLKCSVNPPEFIELIDANGNVDKMYRLPNRKDIPVTSPKKCSPAPPSPPKLHPSSSSKFPSRIDKGKGTAREIYISQSERNKLKQKLDRYKELQRNPNYLYENPLSTSEEDEFIQKLASEVTDQIRSVVSFTETPKLDYVINQALAGDTWYSKPDNDETIANDWFKGLINNLSDVSISPAQKYQLKKADKLVKSKPLPSSSNIKKKNQVDPIYSDSNNCPNVLYFLIVHNIASHSDQTEPKCWCM
jgi:hypothetical protein